MTVNFGRKRGSLDPQYSQPLTNTLVTTSIYLDRQVRRNQNETSSKSMKNLQHSAPKKRDRTSRKYDIPNFVVRIIIPFLRVCSDQYDDLRRLSESELVLAETVRPRLHHGTFNRHFRFQDKAQLCRPGQFRGCQGQYSISGQCRTYWGQ